MGVMVGGGALTDRKGDKGRLSPQGDALHSPSLPLNTHIFTPEPELCPPCPHYHLSQGRVFCLGRPDEHRGGCVAQPSPHTYSHLSQSRVFCLGRQDEHRGGCVAPPYPPHIFTLPAPGPCSPPQVAR